MHTLGNKSFLYSQLNKGDEKDPMIEVCKKSKKENSADNGPLPKETIAEVEVHTQKKTELSPDLSSKVIKKVIKAHKNDKCEAIALRLSDIGEEPIQEKNEAASVSLSKHKRQNNTVEMHNMDRIYSIPDYHKDGELTEYDNKTFSVKSENSAVEVHLKKNQDEVMSENQQEHIIGGKQMEIYSSAAILNLPIDRKSQYMGYNSKYSSFYMMERRKRSESMEKLFLISQLLLFCIECALILILDKKFYKNAFETVWGAVFCVSYFAFLALNFEVLTASNFKFFLCFVLCSLNIFLLAFECVSYKFSSN
ncbi:hypothetical protein EDEG_00627 [Edhazardia aedis USNM 41457]|uniref:Uncharacterized protein n=1 Tax=Edhazardia aedis (strain USNM 41457) TaxID=1003232 RepID=J9DCX5_EDHAE|nr:hypothetical protein EDEG_00627 [Edhazardia aedis USNM 41457]|eukprot:EJW05324.1 hypothetical protein EDEG_00627 [Edhazardia aedis USNM 41457]